MYTLLECFAGYDIVDGGRVGIGSVHKVKGWVWGGAVALERKYILDEQVVIECFGVYFI